ncbi:hypothetical protein CAPTEDRAFT_204565 [Capitella teleta]|uniref:CARD domain-containing protein n=1 Tax=Capitella teleta TaxID=283909 RepID=R7TWA2_CAPTE|nr:hypothetical protein CAPTEDRAFT_204565 [Capitella teleta]|eukprot:ELT98019.1 hypothetical protein CAPTEDRAFT_204565 [Capitella teleta]
MSLYGSEHHLRPFEYPDSLEEDHKDILKNNWTVLCADLDRPTSLIIDHLFQEKILSNDAFERIQQDRKTKQEKARELLTMLLCKDPNAFGVFVRSLESDHPNLHNLLLHDNENRSETTEGGYNGKLGYTDYAT